MAEDNKQQVDKREVDVTVSAPGEWTLKKAFGPVLDEIGQDVKQVYAASRDRILRAGYKKIRDVNDGKQANLRVARDVLWNGALTNDEVCAEYFGGILASSRSEDGSDDSVIHYVDVIKSLSSKQLKLHYFIYNGLNKLLVSDDTPVNVGMNTEIEARQIYFYQHELTEQHGLQVETDLNILHRQGLIRQYRTDVYMVGDSAFIYVSAQPTTFGVLLYAAAHDRLEQWREFDRVDLGDFDGIQLPQAFFRSIQELADYAGLGGTREPE
jgi:hypothetical protein